MFQTYSVSGGLEAEKTCWSLLILSAGERFHSLFGLSSFLSSRLLWSEKKKSPFLSWPIWYSPGGVRRLGPPARLPPPPPPPLLFFVPLSFALTEPSDLLRSPLLNMGTTHLQQRGQGFTGVTFGTRPPRSKSPCEAEQRAKDQGGTIVTHTTSFSTHRTHCCERLVFRQQKGWHKEEKSLLRDD